MRVAIMQPYFLPYAGYFRLLAGADAFVVLDDVQFPRTGWVHRNRLARMDGRPAWLTLPLQPMPVDTRIRDLLFHERAAELWAERLRGFQACVRPTGTTEALVEAMRGTSPGPAPYLVGLLRIVAGLLGFHPRIVLASDLDLPVPLGRTGRLVAICERLGATGYLNAPNGRALYAPADFAARGIRLEFLPDYVGNSLSILQRLHEEPVAAIRREILANMN